jgi:uncharacterized SAM-binding protein YcdF (DUF218 family)
MYWLKKLISAGMQPHSVLLIMIGVGLILLRFTKKHRAGKILFLIGCGGMFLSSIDPVANALVRPLESTYPPLLPSATEPVTTLSDGSAAPAWIVVLGGGSTVEPGLAPLQQLSSATVARLNEGIRLQRLFPESKLLLSGSAAHSHLVAGAAQSLGVPRDRITLAPDVLDTVDEARALHSVLGQERFVLVTSAMHMPRAMALCHKSGTRPIAAPTDFVSDNERWSPRHLLDLFPNSSAAWVVQGALHEYLGLLWAKLRGQI